MNGARHDAMTPGESCGRMDWDVVVIGAGAAGLVAAERAAARGRRTLLLEKNRRPGVKILMSGGTRCNLTQATDRAGIVEAFGPQGRFLHSALAQLSPQDLVALVENEGVATKVEVTGKIFPVSNRATDILAAFVARLERTPCEWAGEEPVLDIEVLEEAIGGGFRLRTTKRTTTTAKLIITSGGKSYPGCGTSGDGYAWAEQLGHGVAATRPALTPITSNDRWLHELKGVTIDDVSITLVNPQGETKRQWQVDQRRDSFLFTHFGLSGPAILDISRAVSERPEVPWELSCDFLPQLGEAEVEAHLKQAAAMQGKRQVAMLLPEAVPRRLAEALVQQAKLAPELRGSELSKSGRARLVELIKHTSVRVSGTLGFKKAEVTAGGVRLDEVDSSTMQSKRVPNLYWAGEVLDLDGPIGGYNFQAAFSTGWLAGLHV